MVKIRGCSKCLGATMLTDDGYKCIICGYTDYSTAPTYKIKRKDNEEVDTIIVRKHGQRYLKDGKSVYVMTFTNGHGNKALRYEMNCPYESCGERSQSSKYPKSGKFKYKCSKKHIWYLIMEDDEPTYWTYRVKSGNKSSQ